jgi:hypothetical protein
MASIGGRVTAGPRGGPAAQGIADDLDADVVNGIKGAERARVAAPSGSGVQPAVLSPGLWT